MNIRQPEVSALKLERQSLVIDAQQMQNGSLQIVNVDGVFGDAHRQVV
jgi:hypothetical protein